LSSSPQVPPCGGYRAPPSALSGLRHTLQHTGLSAPQAPLARLGLSYPRCRGSPCDRFGQPLGVSYLPNLPRFVLLVPPSASTVSGSHVRHPLLRAFSGRLQFSRWASGPTPVSRVSSAKDSKKARLLRLNLQHLPKHHRITHSAQRPLQGTAPHGLPLDV
jgi:hypothetical protein